MLDRPLQKIIPKADDLLRMSLEELAPGSKLAAEQYQQAGFTPGAVTDVVLGDGYPGHKKAQTDTHIARVWNWIERKGLIEPSAGINGHHGWRMFTKEGEAVANGASFEAVRAAQEIPLALLHEAVTAKCRALYELRALPRGRRRALRW